jgi:thiazole synthase
MSVQNIESSPQIQQLERRMASPAATGNQPFRIGPFEVTNRLFVGTGKYANYDLMQEALDARLVDKEGRSLLDFLDLDRYVILPNTAGCFTADDAIRVALLGRDLLEKQGNRGAGWVKLEVLGDKKTLLPDPVGTIEATKELVKEGFTVLAYTSDDPRSAIRIKEAGAASVMPAGSPIGSGQGVLNPLNISLCLELLKENDATFPVIVDAGVGTASDTTIAMELGADGVLLNTGIAHAKDPVKMANAMRHALEAGRLSYQAGRIPKKRYATASSPFEGVISYIPGE